MNAVNFRKHMKSLTNLPQGFTGAMETEQRGREACLVYVVRSETVEIRFDQNGGGHTNFKVDGQQLSFDRLGVSDSFYHAPFGEWDTETYNLNDILSEQIRRINEYVEYHKTAVQVPGIPFSVASEKVKELTARLHKSGSISFRPGGFGTGYEVSKTSGRGFHRARRATKAMEEFFGIAPLYVSTFECD